MGARAGALTHPTQLAADVDDEAYPALPGRGQGNSLALSFGVATFVGVCLVWTYRSAPLPLPGFWLGAIFLTIIAQQDMWRRKIPNWATGSGLVLALAYHVWQSGSAGVLPALAGIALPFVLLLAPYAARAVGAGDVKAFMVIGGLWGVSTVLSIMAWSIIIAGVVALSLVTLRGELLLWLRRWGRMLAMPFIGGGLRYVPPRPEEAAARGLPLGTAIGVAATAHILFGGPWS
jgi:prepilin peptidase CpaA